LKRSSGCLAVKVEDENAFPFTSTSPARGEEKKGIRPLPPGEKEKRNKAFPMERQGKNSFLLP